ncbi:MAG: helix-turn-helix transcriptional regulator [Nitriliruptorales bacterium]|nr:helix-turn-helix transcriptional regulator [Nitriliruptorales bacterium]
MGASEPGELVRRCRTAAGLTQHELAIRAGTTKTAISRLEGGHVSPTFETLERLLLCLGYRLDLETVRLESQTDPAQLDALAELTPSQRLDHGLASLSSLHDLLGAARDD